MEEVSIEGFETGNIRRNLALLLDSGACNSEVITTIKRADNFAPIECEIIDYKESLPADAFGVCKLIRHIVAFFNTYGGYIVFGVEETKAETEFLICGCDTSTFDLKKIKDKIYSYVGIHIALSSWSHTDENGRTILILYIPKRIGEAPAYFGKESATDSKGKFAFRKGDTYLRLGDNSEPASGPEFAFLFSKRECRYLISNLDHIKKKTETLEHNLPDRNFICPKFIGRKKVIESLWSWFADEFSYVRVLAGEGGLGKSSIAYEFAQQVCATGPIGLQRVLWVTAKKEQFIADVDKFIQVPETHYGSYISLLERLCVESAISLDELSGADDKLLRRFLKDALEIFPTLVIIDDVDSLSKDDQRRVLELAMQLGKTNSRFLLTTRMNLTYSRDIAIEIEGLIEEEYRDYIALLSERFKGPQLSPKDIAAFQSTTHGSPLFTDSLYRLVRRGQSCKAAAEEWKGRKGVEARSAALQREITSLKVESKRVLLAAAILHSCSLTELRQATQYTVETLEEAIDELSALFLISAPRIGREPRYEVLDTVAILVLQIKDSLVPDHAKFSESVLKLRKTIPGTPSVNQNTLVGNAINEALAFIRAGNPAEALNTVTIAQRRSKYHPDLYVMQGKCLLLLDRPRYDDARKALQKAYDGKVRKPLLFDLWYEAETQLNHSVGALAVSDIAITDRIEPQGQWNVNRAVALIGVAKDHEKAGYFDSAMKSYDQAADSAFASLNLINPSEQQGVKDVLFEIHDAIFRQTKFLNHTPTIYFDTAQYVLRMTERKDIRRITLSRLVDCLENGSRELSNIRGSLFTLLVSERESLKEKVISTFQKAKKFRQNDEAFLDDLRIRLTRL
ncbi:putative DNA binding domain-containing protein [Herbaspirillum sp. WGmk3]|uniref:RNA-binding domain-containing protein n=1 Tax=Herbaspirillum sp. WGmk3 TaxID=2919925 RepID=UPI0020902ACC|nr:RNA-binding domain-containing protein [Herbaspirillum sp. WGmk3]MCO4856994.1 putative DNA binding domain-containing protein [Herbaspirillum sp. WGmk3]